ncbi:MAG: phage tail tape measure protein [Massilioclostridium sp.]|nr:phage tail tape measure protein [Massilioclostridium sp.]
MLKITKVGAKMSDNMSESKHIASLDFDISKISEQMKEIRNILAKNMPDLRTLWEGNFSLKNLNSVMDKQYNNLSSKLRKMENEITSFSKKAKLDVDAKEALKEIQDLQKQIDKLKNSKNTVKINVKTDEKATGSSGSGKKKPTSTAEDSSNYLKNRIKGQVLLEAEQAAVATLNTLKDVESASMEIGRILNLNIEQTKTLTSDMFDVAQDYARSIEDTQDITKRFAQAGYSRTESLTMTKDALLAMNTAELDAVNSTNSMIGILKQWGLDANDLITVIDKLNYTADNNAITTQDLVDGMLKASSMAKTANMSFNDTVGVLTAVKEASGATGKEVGNAVKSILAYIQRPESLEWFDANGIKVFADESKNALIPMMDILQNMTIKWKEFTTEQQDALMSQMDAAGLFTEEMANAGGAMEDYSAAVDQMAEATNTANTEEARAQAQAAAGVYRRNYYIALMNNFSKATQVSADMINAEGHSAQENSRYMETLEAKYQQLITSLKQLAVEAGNAGLMDLAKGAVDAAKAVTNLTRGIGGLYPTMMLVLGVITIAKRQKLANGLDKLNTKLTNIPSTLKAIFTSGQGLSGAFSWIGVALTALSLITAAISAYNRAQDEMRQKAAENADAYSQSNDSLNETIQKYQELKEELDAGTLSHDEEISIKEQLLGIQDELTEKYGKEASQLNLVNGELKDQLGLLNDLSKAQAEKHVVENRAEAEKARDALNKNRNYLIGNFFSNNDLTGVTEDQNKIIQYLNSLNNDIIKFQNQNLGHGDNFYELKITANAEDAYNTMSDLFKKVEEWGKNENIDVSDILTKISDQINGVWTDSLNDSKKIYNEYIQAQVMKNDELRPMYAETIKAVEDYNAALKSGDSDSIQEAKQKYDDLKASVSEITPTVEGSQEAFDLLYEKVDTASEGIYKMTDALQNDDSVKSWAEDLKNFDKVDIKAGNVAAFELLKIKADEFGVSVEQLISLLEKLGYIQEGTLSDDPFAHAFESLPDVVKTVDDLETQTNNLAAANENFSRISDIVTNKLTISGEEAAYLCNLYPDLEKNILATADGFQIESGAMNVLQSASDSLKSAYIAAQNAMTSGAYAQISQRLSNLGIELSAIQTIGQAYAALAAQKKVVSDVSYPFNENSLPSGSTAIPGLTQVNLNKLVSYQNDLKNAQSQLGKTQSSINSIKASGSKVSRGSTAAQREENKALQEYLDLLEHRKSMGEFDDNQLAYVQGLEYALNHLARTQAEQWDLEEKIYSARKQALEEQRQKAIDAVNDQIDAFEHLNNMGAYTLDQQISFYRQLLNTASYTTEMRRKYESSLFDLYKKQIQQKLDLAEKEKDKKIQAIEDAADAEIAALRKVEDERSRDRDKEDYEKERQELLDQIRYWEQRTSRESVEKQKQLKEQLAELDKEWARKQEDWETEDQIQQIEDKKNREIEALNNLWEQVQNKFTEENLDMLARAGVYSQELYNNYYSNFLNPFSEGMSNLAAQLEALANAKIPSVSIPSPSLNTPSGGGGGSSSSGGGGGSSGTPSGTVTVKGSATHFFASKTSNQKIRMKPFVPGGSYDVMQVYGDRVLIGRNGVWTGWISKYDLVGYAKGTMNALANQPIKLNENGLEAIVTPEGTVTSLPSSGYSVIPSNITKNLMDIGRYTASDFLQLNALNKKQILDAINYGLAQCQRETREIIKQVVNNTTNYYNTKQGPSYVVNNNQSFNQHNTVEDKTDAQAVMNEMERRVKRAWRR